MRVKNSLNPLIEILAAFAAARKYSYLDRIGNSLEPLTALEALKDALRDFDSTCGKESSNYIDRDEAKNLCVPCPKVDNEDLYKAVNSIEELITKKDRRKFLEEIRRLAISALSKASKHRKQCNENG